MKISTKDSLGNNVYVELPGSETGIPIQEYLLLEFGKTALNGMLSTSAAPWLFSSPEVDRTMLADEAKRIAEAMVNTFIDKIENDPLEDFLDNLYVTLAADWADDEKLENIKNLLEGFNQ